MWTVVAVVTVVALVATYLTWLAGRVDRLHGRAAAASRALDAHLVRRAAAAAVLAEARNIPELYAAARAALDADPEDREAAENDLTRRLAALSPRDSGPGGVVDAGLGGGPDGGSGAGARADTADGHGIDIGAGLGGDDSGAPVGTGPGSASAARSNAGLSTESALSRQSALSREAGLSGESGFSRESSLDRESGDDSGREPESGADTGSVGVVAASRRVAVARQVHTDLVRDALAVRRHPLVRLLRLTRRHPRPAYFDIGDPTIETAGAPPAPRTASLAEAVGNRTGQTTRG